MEVAVGYALFFLGIAIFIRRETKRLRDERDSLRAQVQAEHRRLAVMGDRLLGLQGRVSELEAAVQPTLRWVRVGQPFPTTQKPNNGRNLFRKMRDAAQSLDKA